MAHKGEEFGLGPISRLGLAASDVMRRHLIAQYFGLLGHQSLQLVAVNAQFVQRAGLFVLQRQFGDGLGAEHFEGALHPGDFIMTGRANLNVQLAVGQTAHPARKSVNPANDVALNIEPQNRQRYRQHHHGRPAIGQLRGTYFVHRLGARRTGAVLCRIGKFRRLIVQRLGRALQRSL